jgi:MSHA biogenesis protein MshJ
MQRIKDLLRAAADTYEQRGLREKLFLLLGAIAVIAVLWHQLLFRGQMEQTQRLQNRIASVRQEISSLEQEKAELLERLRENRHKELRRKIGDLTERVQELDKKVRVQSKELISPRRMARQLREVLHKSQGLELTRMANRPPSKVDIASLTDASEEVETASLPELYRHPLSITFKGEYSQAVAFFGKMQKMSSRFFWDQLDYSVVDHPTARLHLKVHTLSLDKAWIGF